MRKASPAAAVAVVILVAACHPDGPTAPGTLRADASMTVDRRQTQRRSVNDADLRLHPNGFGFKTYAAWKANQGEHDSRGDANQALYFQKQALTAQFVAAVAVVRGIEGMPVEQLTGLEWERKTDEHCGAGAPRWNVTIAGASGTRYRAFLGCAAALHSEGREAGWTRDTYGGPGAPSVRGAIAGSVGSEVASDALAGTVEGLAIFFDEGRDAGTGFVHLDNIRVNSKTWTYAGDNGGQTVLLRGIRP